VNLINYIDLQIVSFCGYTSTVKKSSVD